MGKAILDLLSEHAADHFAPANRLLEQEYTRLADSIHRRTGFGPEQLSDTVVMGAPFGLRPAAWTISFDRHRGRTNPAIGSYVANWPQTVPVEVRRDAEGKLLRVFQGLDGELSIGGLAKALVHLVATAAEHAVEVGSYAQIGLTIGSSPAARESYYLQGKSAELLSVPEAQLSTRIERLA